MIAATAMTVEGKIFLCPLALIAANLNMDVAVAMVGLTPNLGGSALIMLSS
jgi:hypothetical protein